MFRKNRRCFGGAITLIFIAMVLVACGEDEQPEPTTVPTIQSTEVVLQSTATATRAGPTSTASPTFPPTITLAPASPTSAPLPTAVPSETPGPYVHTIAQNDTCLELAIFYDSSVDAITEANEGLICSSLQIGQTVRVPRPTATSTPPGFDLTATAIVEALPTRLRNATPFNIYEYCAASGDTLTSIALQNGTTSKRICELNPLPDGIDCRVCDFSTDPMGDCGGRPPLIVENKCYNVPGATYTPTFTPTFSGSETPTSTPTQLPPRLVLPANEATLQGPVQLVWAAIHQLRPEEYFVVTITDEQTGASLFKETRSTNYILPDEWQPAAGQTRQIVWTVAVAVRTEDGLFIPVSGSSITQRFIWQSR